MPKTSEDTVTILKSEYEHLIKRDGWLDCLEAAGVDNWQGYDEARRIARDEEDEDGEE